MMVGGRKARKLTQDALGQTLQVGQPVIAKLEKRTGMVVANLRRFVEAMGGELEIVAHFPDGDVTINNFSELGGLGAGARRRAEGTETRRRGGD